MLNKTEDGYGKKKILLVDDEPAIVRLLEATLKDDQRYTLVVARNGEEAVAVATKEAPDLVILDILMPKMDGFQVCRAIKQSPLGIRTKVVMLTALAQDEDRARARGCGADAYFTKPFSPTELLNIVEGALPEKG